MTTYHEEKVLMTCDQPVINISWEYSQNIASDNPNYLSLLQINISLNKNTQEIFKYIY